MHQRCRLCQVRAGLRIVGVLLLLVTVICAIYYIDRSPVGTMMWPWPALHPMEMTARAIAIDSWWVAGVCVFANMGLWFWCRHTHRERAGWRSLLLVAAWLVI